MCKLLTRDLTHNRRASDPVTDNPFRTLHYAICGNQLTNSLPQFVGHVSDMWYDAPSDEGFQLKYMTPWLLQKAGAETHVGKNEEYAVYIRNYA